MPFADCVSLDLHLGSTEIYTEAQSRGTNMTNHSCKWQTVDFLQYWESYEKVNCFLMSVVSG